MLFITKQLVTISNHNQTEPMPIWKHRKIIILNFFIKNKFFNIFILFWYVHIKNNFKKIKKILFLNNFKLQLLRMKAIKVHSVHHLTWMYLLWLTAMLYSNQIFFTCHLLFNNVHTLSRPSLFYMLQYLL